MSNISLDDDEDDLIMGPNEAKPSKPKKKKVKKGIFGYPLAAKRDRILFLINNGILDDDDSSDDDSLDLDFQPDTAESAKKAAESPLKPNKPRTPTKRALTQKSKSMTDEIIMNKKPRTPIKTPKKSIPAIKEAEEARETSTNWSNDLPYEILFKIFNYATYSMRGDLTQLHSLRAVCKNWTAVGNDARLWHHVEVSNFFPVKYIEPKTATIQPKSKLNTQLHTKFNSLLNKLIKSSIDGESNNKFRFVIRLDLSYLNCLTCDDLEVVLRNCNSSILRELNLSHCRKLIISAKSLNYEQVIADYCPNLKSLNLTKMDKQLNSNLLGTLFKVLGLNLTDLNISQNIISAVIINSLALECKNLEHLDISNSDIKGWLNLDYMSENWPKLKRLQLLNTSPKIKYNTVESAMSSSILFTNLEELNLSFSSKYGADPIDPTLLIPKLCKDALKLKSLDIRSFKSPLDCVYSLFSMVTSTQLERLYLCNSFLSDADNELIVEAIGDKWSSSLIELDFSWSNISHSAMDGIIASFIKNKETCKLRRLNLTGTCVDSTQILKLIKSIRTIRVINLDSCRSIDRGMKKTLSTEDFADLVQ